jgi:hypothetical protein
VYNAPVMGARELQLNNGGVMSKPYQIVVKNLDGWYSAMCPQLCVSGFGSSRDEAIEALARSMGSTLEAQASSIKKDPKNVLRMAELEAA